MKQVKLFETSEMPEEVFNTLKEAYIKQDGIETYCVGFQVKESSNFIIEQPDYKDEYTKDVSKFTVVDDYFKSHGAEHMEQILIHHGEFHEKQIYLF